MKKLLFAITLLMVTTSVNAVILTSIGQRGQARKINKTNVQLEPGPAMPKQQLICGCGAGQQLLGNRIKKDTTSATGYSCLCKGGWTAVAGTAQQLKDAASHSTMKKH